MNNLYIIIKVDLNNLKVIIMQSEDRLLARKQLDKRLDPLRGSQTLLCPPRGWIKAIREALGLTTAQLGVRLGVSQPRVVDIEKAEKTKTLTLATLERAANAMDCKLVYGFVPKKSLQEMVKERARKIARKRLETTRHSMVLEAQSVSLEDETEQLEAMVQKILEKAGSELWKIDNE